jgi:hypothetical protein
MRAGDWVRLLPFEEQPEEEGVVLSVDRDTAIVQLHDYIADEDDGIREVPFGQIVLMRDEHGNVLRGDVW